jgi:hypothetical protein
MPVRVALAYQQPGTLPTHHLYVLVLLFRATSYQFHEQVSQLLADKLTKKARLIRIEFKGSALLTQRPAIGSSPEAVQSNRNYRNLLP